VADTEPPPAVFSPDGSLTVRIFAIARGTLLDLLAAHQAVQVDCTAVEAVDLSFSSFCSRHGAALDRPGSNSPSQRRPPACRTPHSHRAASYRLQVPSHSGQVTREQNHAQRQ
jgi:hypothetical protein